MLFINEYWFILLKPLNRLVYDETTDTFQDHKDVTIQVPGFGGTDGLRTGVLDSFIEYFVERGYVGGESIRTAPYDWRLAAGEILTYTNLTVRIFELLYIIVYWSINVTKFKDT